MTPPQSPPTRLHLVGQPTPEQVFEPDSVSDLPLIRFVAFGSHHRFFGWVRLRADRLTDLLNLHPELHLADVEIETFKDGIRRSVDDITIERRELIAVFATGPRGDWARRQDTETHFVAVESGNYLIRGHLHVEPGAEPMASVRERPSMFPLTDAWIEYRSGTETKHQSTGTIIVNRDRADSIQLLTDRDR